jgi:hypothetical protein
MSNFICIFFLAFVFSLSACVCTNDPIDIDQVNKRVNLNSADLQNFKRLSEALVQDLPKIRSVTPSGNGNSWLETNSYYLDQIDSAKYSALLAPLKGKQTDRFWITESGETQFVLKEYTQMKCNTYDDSYTHLLVSTRNNIPAHLIFRDLQVMYVDSVINQYWKYQYFMTHSGW